MRCFYMISSINRANALLFTHSPNGVWSQVFCFFCVFIEQNTIIICFESQSRLNRALSLKTIIPCKCFLTILNFGYGNHSVAKINVYGIMNSFSENLRRRQRYHFQINFRLLWTYEQLNVYFWFDFCFNKILFNITFFF